jgi:hypothetical protein
MALRVEIHRDCFLRRLGRLGHRAWHVPRTIQHPFSCGYDSSAVCRICEYRFPSHVAVADMSSPLLSGSFGSGGSSIVMVRL